MGNVFFNRIACSVSKASGSLSAFVAALGVVIVWAGSGPLFRFNNTWQLVINTGTTIVTFLMVFLIQNAQNRDASAIQAKLDELIRALGDARDDFIGLEHLSTDELEKVKSELEREANGDTPERHRSLDRLLGRL